MDDQAPKDKPSFKKMTSRWLAGWFSLAVLCGLLAHTAHAAPVVVLSNTPNASDGGSPIYGNISGNPLLMQWKALLFSTSFQAAIQSVQLGLNSYCSGFGCYPRTVNVSIELYSVVGGLPANSIYTRPYQAVILNAGQQLYTFAIPSWWLAPGQTYALVLKSNQERSSAYKWGKTNTDLPPTTSYGFSFQGMKVTNDGAATWNDNLSAIDNAIVISATVYSPPPVIVISPDDYPPPVNVLLGGLITGLRVASDLVLLNNGANPATFNQTGVFSFPGGIPTGSRYNVTVGTQPPGQTCRVANGSGVANSTVNNLEVRCVNNLYRIGGTVTGLAAGQRVRLVNNGVESLEVSTNGAFTFLQGAAWNGRYNVIVGTQPTTQTCTVTGGTGFSVRSNVTNIRVNCSGGTIAGGQTLPRSGLITAPRGSTTLYENMDYDTAPGRENTVRIAIAALTNVRLTYPDFFNDRVSGKHELIGGLEVQGYARDYLATSHYGMVTLVQKTTGQTIAYQVTRPQPGPNNSGINVDFLDGSIGFTSHLTPPLPDLPNGRWTLWITRGGVSTEGWGNVPGIPLLPENPVDLGQVGNALNPTVNSQDIDWSAVQ